MTTDRRAHTAQQLRALAGMGIVDFAEQAGLAEEELRAVEGGRADEPTRRRLWQGLGLDPDKAEQGYLSRDPDQAEQGYLSRGGKPRLFSLVGERSKLSLSDLGQLLEALRLARRRSVQSDSAPRRGLLPVPIPGHMVPHQQGYALARRLRRELGLGTARLDQTFGARVQERLGISVLRLRLSQEAPAALGLIDRDRRAAAIVLRDGRNRMEDELFRIGHELCHLLFDPLEAGRLQLSLGGPDQGRSAGASAPLEARANAFAAELLLPLEGLQELLGAQEPTASPEEGRERLRRAVESFGASTVCTLYHLKNRRYVDPNVHDLLASSPERPRPSRSEKLDLVSMEDQRGPEQDDASLAEEAQRAELLRGQRMVEDCVHQALQSAEEGKERMAGLILSRLADELQWAGQREPLDQLHAEVERVLVRRYPGVAGAQLINTRSQPWPSKERETLLQSALQAWRKAGHPEDEIEALGRQLALASIQP